MKTISRVNLSAPFRGIDAEIVAKSNKGLSFPRTALLPPFRHWLYDVVGPKVRRFNFYSRQCNIRYSGAIALARRRVPFIARLKSIIREFLFVLSSVRVLCITSLPLSLSLLLSPCPLVCFY